MGAVAEEKKSGENRAEIRIAPISGVADWVTATSQLSANTKTRIGAVAVLVFFLTLLSSVILTAYRAMTDAFVAPLILSPDNDVVLAHEQKVIELETQRQLTEAQAESVAADLQAAEAEEQRLLQLEKQATGDLTALDRQRQLLEEQYEKQKRAVARARQNYHAGLLLQTDYDQQVQLLNQAELALLENKRSKMKTEASATSVDDGKGSNRSTHQVKLELMRVNAEKKAKLAEQRVLQDKIGKLRGLEQRLRGRPISQAIDHALNAAFVPYSEIGDVKLGGRVYSCVWGLFWCSEVGSVTEIVAGEVTMPDPWGNVSRGQYIVLNLNDPAAATAKVLRVRGGEGVDPTSTQTAQK